MAGVVGGVVTYKIVNKVDKSKPPVLVKQLKKAIYNDDKTECLEIGYFKNSHGEIQIETLPWTIKKVPKELPKQITSLNRAFHLNLNSQITNLDNWNTSNITNMEWMFTGAQKFNQDLSKWDVSKVTNMYSMFAGSKMFNQDISKWDTSNVTDMSFMFYKASNFKQNISSWNVSNLLRIAIIENGITYTGWTDFNKNAHPDFKGNKLPSFPK
ncbi:BspA family leucine-rich repeat surface protein [Mycoplasma capricolum subsp. capricolum]|uniref:BspA family leucine-rich repeat surface protein n=1 Tax=Mycoplasma capricolum TaxID=2095 RepID=UPI003DA3AB07